MADYQLEIHHIDVTGGDCMLIVVRNLSKKNNPVVHSVLVDAGGIGQGPKKMLKYLQEFFPSLNKINLFIASHYHDDHIRGVTFINTETGKSLVFEKILDVGPDNDSCHPAGVSTFDGSVSTSPGYIKVYNKFCRDYWKKGKQVLPDFLNPQNYKNDGTPLKTLGPYVISLTDGNTDTKYQMKIWCGKGVLADGTNVIGDQGNHTNAFIDANDLSIGFTLHGPGGFTYFSAGDLSGDLVLKTYRNVEGALVSYMAKQSVGPINVVKATHHGSEYNNHKKSTTSGAKTNVAPGFLETFQPEVVIVQCNQAKQVPAAEYLSNRLSVHLKNDNSRKAYFLNKLSYRKGALFQAFDTLFNTKQTNIIYEKPYYKISRTTSVVVVHQAGKKFSQPFDLDCDELSKHGEYRIYRNSKDIGFAMAMGERSSNAIRIPISNKLKEAIYSNFEEQANELMRWFLEGIMKGPPAKDNIESYISEQFPALYTADEFPQLVKDLSKTFKNTLVKKMTDMFETIYYYDSITSAWLIKKDGFTESQEDTMTALLSGNYYQPEFNFTLDRYNKSLQEQLLLINYNIPAKQTKEDVGVKVKEIKDKIQGIYKNKNYRKPESTVQKVLDNVYRFIEEKKKE